VHHCPFRLTTPRRVARPLLHRSPRVAPPLYTTRRETCVGAPRCPFPLDTPRRAALLHYAREARRCTALSVSTGRSASRRSSLYSTTRGTRAGAPFSVSTGLVSRSHSFSLDGSSTSRATALAAIHENVVLSPSSVVANRARRKRVVACRLLSSSSSTCPSIVIVVVIILSWVCVDFACAVFPSGENWLSAVPLVRATRKSRAMEIRTRVSRRGGCCTVVNHRTWRHNGVRSHAIRV